MNCCRKEANKGNEPADIEPSRRRASEEVQGLSIHQSDTPNLQTRDTNGVTLQTLHIHVHEAASAYTPLNQRLEHDTHFYEVISSSLTCLS